jgi:sterol-4alpha-carboxylate 3-dehydrogenase (decarboxylating)
VIRALLEKYPQCSIVAVDIALPTTNGSPNVGVKYMRTDITVAEDVLTVMLDERPDVVIHTAGIVPDLTERYRRRQEKRVMQVNVDGTRNVLEASKAANCKAFVYTSSCCAVIDDWRNSYPNIDETWPVSPHSSIYGESKVLAEALVLDANSTEMATCVLRPAVIFGEGDHQLIPPIHACIEKRETPFIIGEGMNLWDTVYVGNVADSHVIAAENLLTSRTAAGETFFIQNNEPISFRDFQLAVWKNFGHYPPFEITIPKGMGWILGMLVEAFTWLFGTTATLSRGSVNDACAVRYASGEKARRVLGFEPKIGLEEGLRRSCEVSHEMGRVYFQRVLSANRRQEYARRLQRRSNSTSW